VKSILVTDHVFPNLDPERSILDGIGILRQVGTVSDVELMNMARDADAILNCYRPLSAELLGAMKNCRIIARYGIGVDTVPLQVATSLGIQVTNVPDYCIEEVADHSLALILAFTRGIVRGLDQTRAGGWDVTSLRPIHRQRGRTLGLVGFGRIARALADRGKALGYDIVAFDPHLSDEAFRAAGARPVDLDTLFRDSDVISLHAPLTPETRHMVDAQRLATMRQGSILVSTARGGLVDYEAVVAALRAGTLGGAGLDVLETEPPAPGSTSIAGVPNLIVTPHLAFYSEQALIELQRKAALQVRAVLEGRHPDYPVNMVQERINSQ
jgi:D-3-phosphoglycerate dehydrogenase